MIMPYFSIGLLAGLNGRCGTIGERLPLSVRAWMCEYCGSKHDRDIAAARMINFNG
jgi:transposase